MDNVLIPGVDRLTGLPLKRESMGLGLNLWLQEVISSSTLIQIVRRISNLDFRSSEVKISESFFVKKNIFLILNIIRYIIYIFILFKYDYTIYFFSLSHVWLTPSPNEQPF